MPVPLTLGLPPRPEQRLLTGLLEADDGAGGAGVVEVAAGPGTAAEVGRVLATGAVVGLPAGIDPDSLADALAVLAHAERPCRARAADAAGVLVLLAATVAALRGADVRAAARREPDAAALLALSDAAGAAVREVLGTVAVPDPAAVAADLAARGLHAR